MKKYLFFILIFFLLIRSYPLSNTIVENNNQSIPKVDKIVANAMQYEGVRYKYGGTTKKGMDCSGIVYTAFGKENIKLPRTSREMAKRGNKISLAKVKKGDLLFFKAGRKYINHVGLVISIKNKQIRFIHATTSRGVIISLLSEKYWKNAFVKAVRVL
ncbi:MAG: C40 family peptidase [Polaribacter sp.]